MVHSNVWKFEKIWLSGILIIIRKPKVWRTDGHEDPLDITIYPSDHSESLIQRSLSQNNNKKKAGVWNCHARLIRLVHRTCRGVYRDPHVRPSVLNFRNYQKDRLWCLKETELWFSNCICVDTQFHFSILTCQVSLVEQDLLTLLGHLRSPLTF
jgi:hypothetical protein